jgi:hypothetical protein
MQRTACTLIALALMVFATLGAMLLGDSFAPARLPPLFAGCAAGLAGLVLMLGLALLDHRGEAKRRVRFG